MTAMIELVPVQVQRVLLCGSSGLDPNENAGAAEAAEGVY